MNNSDSHVDVRHGPVILQTMKAGGKPSRVSRRPAQKSHFARPLLAFLVLVTGAVTPVTGQTVRAILTYHNVGVHVEFSSAVPPSASIAMAIREEGAGAAADYRNIHPLSRITENRFAGSA